ncbi:MAG TPA: hypothetical protein ENI61_02530, partial [Ignavibacteria bacterium]|nr:hypothetical protein [Ignavibacteria bacterium]
MDSTSMINEKQPNLSIIKEQLFAGKAALTPEQLENFLLSLEDLIEKIYTGNLFADDKSIIENRLSILENLIPAQLAKDLMKKIEPDIFYNFGQYLLSLLKNEGNSLQSLIRQVTHVYLNLFRFSEFLTKIYGDKKWEILIHDLILISNFNIFSLFRQRVSDYGNRTLFKELHGSVEINYSWNTIFERTQQYAKSILKLLQDANNDNRSVALLMENELSMAILDLACLTNGIVNIMIPANSVPHHLSYILNETKAPVLITSDEKQLHKVKIVKEE